MVCQWRYLSKQIYEKLTKSILRKNVLKFVSIFGGNTLFNVFWKPFILTMYAFWPLKRNISKPGLSLYPFPLFFKSDTEGQIKFLTYSKQAQKQYISHAVGKYVFK